MWCKCVSVYLLFYTFTQRSPIEVEEEWEREVDWMEAPSPYGISQWGPQTPSVFPPPSPYSYSYAESFHEEARSLEMGPPRAVPTQVCFGYVVVVFCTELCLTVLQFVSLHSRVPLAIVLTNAIAPHLFCGNITFVTVVVVHGFIHL